MAGEWRYKLTDEDYANMGTSGMIKKLAEAMSGGLKAYIATQPKPLVEYNPMASTPEEKLRTVGMIPTGSEVRTATPPQTSKIMIPQYNDKGQITGYTEQDVAGKGSNIKMASAGSARAGFNMPLEDAEASDVADQIQSGTLSPSDISKFSKGIGSVGARNWGLINKKLKEKYPNFNMGEYEQAWSYSNSRPIRTYLANIETAEGELGIFKRLNDEFARTGMQGINKLLQKGEIQFGGIAANNFETAKQAFIDSLSTVLGAAGVSPTDQRLEQARRAISGAQTTEQIQSALKLVNDLITIRKHSVNAQGLPGFWDKYYGNKEETYGLKKENKEGAKTPQGKDSDPLGIR